MARKLKLMKDASERERFSKNEFNKLLFKFMVRQNLLSKVKKHYVYYYYSRLLLNGFSKYRNICLFTGKMRFVYKYFKLSRMRFKNFASYGYMMGVSKSSW